MDGHIDKAIRIVYQTNPRDAHKIKQFVDEYRRLARENNRSAEQQLQHDLDTLPQIEKIHYLFDFIVERGGIVFDLFPSESNGPTIPGHPSPTIDPPLDIFTKLMAKQTPSGPPTGCWYLDPTHPNDIQYLELEYEGKVLRTSTAEWGILARGDAIAWRALRLTEYHGGPNPCAVKNLCEHAGCGNPTHHTVVNNLLGRGNVPISYTNPLSIGFFLNRQEAAQYLDCQYKK